MRYSYLESPVGRLLLAGEAGKVKMIAFPRSDGPQAPREDWIEDGEAMDPVVRQLEEYFAGERRQFDLDLGPEGTEFQRKVWWALAKIPYGETISYGDLARRVGRPTAYRAVGAANGRNPLPIVLPCHRVIGSDGSLTGFGGGLWAKERLLRLESSSATAQLCLSD